MWCKVWEKSKCKNESQDFELRIMEQRAMKKEKWNNEEREKHFWQKERRMEKKAFSF